MKKIDFPLIADVAFYSVCTFFLSLALLRYSRVALSASLALAALFALAAGGLAFLFLHGKHRRRALKRSEIVQKNALMLHLALERAERVRAALLKALAADGKNAHCEGDALSSDGIAVVPLFTMQPVSADDVARLIREYGTSPFRIACNALSPESEALLSSFGIDAMRGDEIFELFRRTDTAPSPLICGELPRRTIGVRLRRAFSKKNARPFFAGGVFLLAMSLFTLFPVYYILSGAILLATSVAVRLFGTA